MQKLRRSALIGSTALRIDTPDSDLDVVVYTCDSFEAACELPALRDLVTWLPDGSKSEAAHTTKMARRALPQIPFRLCGR